MALHELGTNAAKHGALSNTDGTLSIEWSVVGRGKTGRFRIRWLERGGPPPELSQKRGFGRTVMVDIVQQALDAEVRLTYPPSGAVWELIAPVESTLDTARADPESGI